MPVEHMRNIGGGRSDPALRAAWARLAEAGAVCAAATSIDRLRMATRGSRRHAQTRQLAMYLANVAFGLNYTQVGLCFGRDRTTVRHACACVEDRRDDGAVDLALFALEAGLGALERRLLTVDGRRA